jgi:hypothetical protein
MNQTKQNKTARASTSKKAIKKATKKVRNKYNYSKIYKLVSNQTNEIYIGSTTQKYLCSRLSQHKLHYKLFLEGKYNNMTSFEIVKYGDCQIVLIENVYCQSKDQLLQRERFYIESMVCVNKNMPGRTGKEYHKDYYEANRKKFQQYYQANKDKYIRSGKVSKDKNAEIIKQKNNLYCACGGRYTTFNKGQHQNTHKHKKWVRENVTRQFERKIETDK